MNPPRFQRESASEVKPGPGAHDPVLSLSATRVQKNAVYGFPRDSRSKYLGTSGTARKELPDALVKKAAESAQAPSATQRRLVTKSKGDQEGGLTSRSCQSSGWGEQPQRRRQQWENPRQAARWQPQQQHWC